MHQGITDAVFVIIWKQELKNIGKEIKIELILACNHVLSTAFIIIWQNLIFIMENG